MPIQRCANLLCSDMLAQYVNGNTRSVAYA